jgi:peptide deformylase
MVKLKEGCLSYPFIFLNIERPRKIVGKYEDENGELQEGHFDGYMSRIFQHEYDHTEGRTMVDKVSKFRYDLAKKRADKLLKKHMRELKKDAETSN